MNSKTKGLEQENPEKYIRIYQENNDSLTIAVHAYWQDHGCSIGEAWQRVNEILGRFRKTKD